MWKKKIEFLLKPTRPVLYPPNTLVGNERWFLLNLRHSLTQEKNGADTVNFNVMRNLNSVHSCRRNLLGNNESDAYSNIKCHRTNIEISNFIIIGCDDYWLLIEIKVTCHLFAADFMWNYFRRTPFCSRMYDTLIDVPIQKCRRQMVILAEKRNLGETYSFFLFRSHLR